MSSGFFNTNPHNRYKYNGPVKGPVKRVAPAKPKPTVTAKPKPAPASTPKPRPVSGRGSGVTVKETGHASSKGKPNDLAKSLYDYYKSGKPMPKSEAVGRPPKSPAVAKSTTAPKPKPSPSSALPSGRPAKPTPKPGATKVSLPPAGPKTKKQAEVAARNVDEARQRALAAQEARKAGSGISHKSESTVTGSNTSIKRTVRIRRNGGIGGGNIGGGGLMNWKIK